MCLGPFPGPKSNVYPDAVRDPVLFVTPSGGDIYFIFLYINSQARLILVARALAMFYYQLAPLWHLRLVEADNNARIPVMPKTDWFTISKMLALSCPTTHGVKALFPRGLVLVFGAWLGGGSLGSWFLI